MKERYIRQVARELSVSRRKRKEIIRDLYETFASAEQHGECEEQVIQRLGEPKDFVEEIEEQLGIDGIQIKKRRAWAGLIGSLAVAAAAFIVCGAARLSRPPANAIGQADGMTQIELEPAASFDMTALLTALGTVALIAAVVQVVCMLRKCARRRRR